MKPTYFIFKSCKSTDNENKVNRIAILTPQFARSSLLKQSIMITSFRRLIAIL